MTGEATIEDTTIAGAVMATGGMTSTIEKAADQAEP